MNQMWWKASTFSKTYMFNWSPQKQLSSGSLSRSSPFILGAPACQGALTVAQSRINLTLNLFIFFVCLFVCFYFSCGHFLAVWVFNTVPLQPVKVVKHTAEPDFKTLLGINVVRMKKKKKHTSRGPLIHSVQCLSNKCWHSTWATSVISSCRLLKADCHFSIHSKCHG